MGTTTDQIVFSGANIFVHTDDDCGTTGVVYGLGILIVGHDDDGGLWERPQN